MGRLTLNVLLSFAQFEREVTGERIRDKIAASKQKGMWMGWQPAARLRRHERKLIVNPAEAETGRSSFRGSPAVVGPVHAWRSAQYVGRKRTFPRLRAYS
jgi:DNA invertase Pin-like site-specific DNA recombinase